MQMPYHQIRSTTHTSVAMAIGAGTSGGGFTGDGLGFADGGGGDGGITFFNKKFSDKHFHRAFSVIDMSKSLKEEQVAVLKHRLVDTLSDFGPRDRFEIAFLEPNLVDRAGSTVSRCRLDQRRELA